MNVQTKTTKPLRARMIDDMTARELGPASQRAHLDTRKNRMTLGVLRLLSTNWRTILPDRSDPGQVLMFSDRLIRGTEGRTDLSIALHPPRGHLEQSPAAR